MLQGANILLTEDGDVKLGTFASWVAYSHIA